MIVSFDVLVLRQKIKSVGICLTNTFNTTCDSSLNHSKEPFMQDIYEQYAVVNAVMFKEFTYLNIKNIVITVCYYPFKWFNMDRPTVSITQYYLLNVLT